MREELFLHKTVDLSAELRAVGLLPLGKFYPRKEIWLLRADRRCSIETRCGKKFAAHYHAGGGRYLFLGEFPALRWAQQAALAAASREI